MRKTDFLRRKFNKIIKGGKETDIYNIELPEEFKRKGDISIPVCVPYRDAHTGMLVGIAVEHTYCDDEGTEFPYYEYFTFI